MTRGKWTPEIRVRSVRPLDGFRLHLSFSNLSKNEFDITTQFCYSVFYRPSWRNWQTRTFQGRVGESP